MPIRKNFPVSANHPAEQLSKLIPEDVKQQLLKTPKKLLIEDQVYQTKLNLLRNNFKYCYIVQWLYLLKHVIKLSDAFDVENFEEEILGIAPPIFLNSFKTKLIQHLKNQKMQNIDDEFDFFVDEIYKDNFNENENVDSVDYNEDEKDQPMIEYSKLSLIEQIQVIYNLLLLSNKKGGENFRRNVDKYEKAQDDLRLIPVCEFNYDNISEQYLVLQDARVYLRKFEYPEMIIPKKLSDYDKVINDPYFHFMNFAPKLIHWECLTVGIYKFDEYVNNLKKSFGKKTSSKEYKIGSSLQLYTDFIIQHDLKKRKQSLQRKREIEMQSLMANRKRSSRLEEKEKRKREEDELRKLELIKLKEQSAELRAAKRLKLKEGMYNPSSSINSTNIETREDRLKKRQENLANKNNNQEHWKFDCVCGVKGEDYDDGSVMISCESCDRWNHLNCQPEYIQNSINSKQDGFKFNCSNCRSNYNGAFQENSIEFEVTKPAANGEGNQTEETKIVQNETENEDKMQKINTELGPSTIQFKTEEKSIVPMPDEKLIVSPVTITSTSHGAASENIIFPTSDHALKDLAPNTSDKPFKNITSTTPDNPFKNIKSTTPDNVLKEITSTTPDAAMPNVSATSATNPHTLNSVATPVSNISPTIPANSPIGDEKVTVQLP